jgi:hypothetical protein
VEVYLKYFEFGTIVADTFKDLFHVFHKSVMEDRLVQFDMSEVSLTLSGLPTSLTLLIQRGNA